MADGYMRFEDLQRISDPKVMGGYVINQVPAVSKFAQAGIFNFNSANNLSVTGDGFVTAMRNLNLGNIRSEPTNDDPADEIQPQKLGTGMSQTVKMYNAFDVGFSNIIRELESTVDPLRVVQQYDAQIWSNEMDRYGAALLSTAMNVAEAAHPGRYTLNISTETGDSANADNRASAEAVLDTLHLDGTLWERYSWVAMSHRVYLHLQKQNLIDFIPDSQGVVRFPTYMGLRAVQGEDEFFTRAGTTNGRVSSMIFGMDGAGSAGMAEPQHVDGSVFVKNEKASHGAGTTEYLSRKRFALALRGITWNPGTPTTSFPTYAEFVNADNWDFNPAYVNENGDPTSIGMLRLQVNV